MKTKRYWIKVNIAKIKFPDKTGGSKEKGRRLVWKGKSVY